MVSMVTWAPTARAPALRARSTLRLASSMASTVRPRTKVSRRTSAGTTFTTSPPRVMMGWTRMVSSSRKVSRRALMACRAREAALRALIPRWGAPPAWAALPV